MVAGGEHINGFGSSEYLGEPKRELLWVTDDVVRIAKPNHIVVIVATPMSPQLRRIVTRLSAR